eukprot:680163-Hanusia_phi.AAC.1
MFTTIYELVSEFVSKLSGTTGPVAPGPGRAPPGSPRPSNRAVPPAPARPTAKRGWRPAGSLS